MNRKRALDQRPGLSELDLGRDGLYAVSTLYDAIHRLFQRRRRRPPRFRDRPSPLEADFG